MRKLLIIIVALLLVSCTQPTSTPTATATAIQAPIQVSPTKPPIEASATPIPTDAPVPTLTSTALPSETPTETLTPTPVVFGPDNYPADVNPLTGLRVSNPALLERRPVAAKLNVVPRSSNRPPWGLSLADIVYDYITTMDTAAFMLSGTARIPS